MRKRDLDARCPARSSRESRRTPRQHHQCGQNPDVGQPHAARRIRHRARQAHRGRHSSGSGGSAMRLRHPRASARRMIARRASSAPRPLQRRARRGRNCIVASDCTCTRVDQERHREYIEHRPAADELHDPEQAAALLRIAHGFTRHRKQHFPHGDELQQRYDDAGEKYQQRERPGAGVRQRR